MLFDALKTMHLYINVLLSRKSFKKSKWRQISKRTPEAQIWNLIQMFDRDGFNNIFDIQYSGNNESITGIPQSWIGVRAPSLY